MMHSIFHQIYVSNLSVIVTALLILPIAWSVFGAFFYKRMRLIGTVLSIACGVVILYATVVSRGESSLGHDLTPFSSFQRAIEQPEMYRSMLMNVFLFVPLGMSLPFVLPVRWKHTMIITVLLAFILSVGIESLQYILSIGRCEVDDVIMNMLGAFIGSCAFLKIRKKSGYAESDK